MFSQELKIARDRVGVLIGKKGEVKRAIEKKGNVKLEIDSEEGDVIITADDGLKLFEVKSIIMAIGRGFSPEAAFRLFDEGYSFESLDITEFTGKSKKKMDRIRGRVIGEEGKARKYIERITDTNISIYGKTVGIIGEQEWVSLAKRAVEMLLSGAPHGPVYAMLEKKRRALQRQKYEGMAYGEI